MQRFLEEVEHRVFTVQGECYGVCIHHSAKASPHLCLTLLVEDDEQWYEIEKPRFDSYWADDLYTVIGQAYDWLVKNATQVKDGSWIY